MSLKQITYFSLLILSVSACTAPRLTQSMATNNAITYHGRTVMNAQNEVDLISSAAYAELQFGGEMCAISLINHAPPTDYNYVAIELDNKYMGRFKVSGTSPTPLSIKAEKKADWHQLRIYKATESQNGVVTVQNIRALRLKTEPVLSQKRIEFIGNSITCGMGNDVEDIPCGNGSKWYDQHNAYWSYAAQVARVLNVDFTLSAISGAGIYRNWNSDEPTVPQQYQRTYLKLDSVQQWDFSRNTPDIVTIALGTNDLSMGDGKKTRLPFDSTVYITTYIDFIKTIYNNYPNAQIVLLNSPMVTGNRNELLMSCLQSIQAKVNEEFPDKKQVKVFAFQAVSATGCSGHPNKEEHSLMAKQLLPYMQEVLNELK